MKVLINDHAQIRLAERNVSEDQVLTALTAGTYQKRSKDQFHVSSEIPGQDALLILIVKLCKRSESIYLETAFWKSTFVELTFDEAKVSSKVFSKFWGPGPETPEEYAARVAAELEVIDVMQARELLTEGERTRYKILVKRNKKRQRRNRLRERKRREACLT